MGLPWKEEKILYMMSLWNQEPELPVEVVGARVGVGAAACRSMASRFKARGFPFKTRANGIEKRARKASRGIKTIVVPTYDRCSWPLTCDNPTTEGLCPQHRAFLNDRHHRRQAA
jgi:hypothetical protein